MARQLQASMIFQLLFLMIEVRRARAADTYANSNAREFGILCKLFRLAAKGIEAPNKGHLREAETLVRCVDQLYAISVGNESEYSGAGRGISGLVKENIRRFPEGHVRSMLAARLKGVLSQAERTGERVKQASESISSLHSRITNLLNGAIYGGDEEGKASGAPNLTQKQVTFGEDSGHTTDKSCGGDGASGANKGDFVGWSLVNDFLCLCVGADNSNGKYCANGVDQAGSATNWASNVISGAKAVWDKIEQSCPDYSQNTTVESLEAALGAFHAQVGLGGAQNDADSNKNGPFLFGKANAVATGCNGAAQQVCVNYNHQLKKGGSGIPWERKIFLAQGNLKELERQVALETRLLNHLENLNETAWAMYVEATAALDHGKGMPEARNQNQNQRQNQTIATDKVNTQDPNSLNASKIPRFLLPLSLFI